MSELLTVVITCVIICVAAAGAIFMIRSAIHDCTPHRSL